MKIFAVAALALLAGCSTDPVSISSATPAPSGSLFAYQAKLAGPSGTLTVIRDSGFIGSVCDMGIYVDGRLIGRLAPKEKGTFRLPQGQYILGAGYVGRGTCGMTTPRRERDLAITDGKASVYRVFTSSDNDIDLLPTTL